MISYFDTHSNLSALQYVVSMVDFMENASRSYLNSIGASNFDYIEYYENGDVLNLTNNKMLIMERFQRKMNYQILFSQIVFSMEYYQPKIFLWPDNPHNHTLETLFQLDVWNGCNIFMKEQTKIVVFSFSGGRTSYDIRSKCNNNQRELFLFMHHFTLLVQSKLSIDKPKYISTDIRFEFLENKGIKSLEIDKGIVLTNRELKIAIYISSGHSASYIAEKLDSSSRTIETHINNIKEKIYDQKKENMTKQELIDFFYQKRWLLQSIF